MTTGLKPALGMSNINSLAIQPAPMVHAIGSQKKITQGTGDKPDRNMRRLVDRPIGKRRGAVGEIGVDSGRGQDRIISPDPFAEAENGDHEPNSPFPKAAMSGGCADLGDVRRKQSDDGCQPKAAPTAPGPNPGHDVQRSPRI